MYSKVNITIIATSFALTIVAYFMENFLGLRACILCKYQQYIYWAIVIFGLLSLLKDRLIYIVTLLILTNIFLSGYQAAVQREIIDPYIFKCDSNSATTTNKNNDSRSPEISFEEYKKRILNHPPAVDCYSNIGAGKKILGYSLAEYNFVLSVVLFLLILIDRIRRKRKYG